MWKEGGKGTFKFNIAALSPDETEPAPPKGRFIMRAHQTYRILLNVPIFKGMKIGDGVGNEPKNKSISFAGFEEGRPAPYMIKVCIYLRSPRSFADAFKLGDVTEIKTLYHEVKKLQEALADS